MAMIEKTECSISQSDRNISDLELHIQNLEAAELRALGLHEKIQDVLEMKRETLRSLQTTAAVRSETTEASAHD
jgi:hypothetical protein